MTVSKIRLHITPFAPDFASSILPATLAAQAENISFHSLQTFPEKTYGFVDLPVMEAEKLKKKLNGSILKGKKIRVEEARPSKRSIQEVEHNDAISPESSISPPAAKKSKKSKAAEETLDGYEMPDDRKVKRGWTEPRRKERKQKTSSGKKEQAASKYSEKEECLFRTKIPKNKQEVKEIKEVQDEQKKKKLKKRPGDAVVHEFQKSTNYPTFLRENQDSAKSSLELEFVEDKGWVDADGNVVEEAPKPPRRSQLPSQVYQRRKNNVPREEQKKSVQLTEKETKAAKSSQGKNKESPEPETFGDTTSSSDITSSEEESEDDDSDEEEKEEIESVDEKKNDGNDDNDDNEDDDDEDDDEDSEDDHDDDDDETSSSGSDSEDSETNEVSQPPSIEASSSSEPAATSQSAPHPLEVLFKRPAPVRTNSATSVSQMTDKSGPKPSLEITTSFSFFDPDVDEQDVSLPPLTPFTSQDRKFRVIRSAAPTPDTAAPSRTSFFPGGSQPESMSGNDEDDEQDEEDTLMANETPSARRTKHFTHDQDLNYDEADYDMDQVEAPAEGANKAEQSEFVKWFYEHRGENNRLWKRRKREAAKEKRQAENRKNAKSAGKRQRQ